MLRLLLIFIIHLFASSMVFCAPNPWANDPLAKVNLFPAANQLNQKANSQETCAQADYCPVCEIAEEWPLDFDADDLAERAQKRTCSPDPNTGFQAQVIVIYDSKGEPIIYKSNLDRCNKNGNKLYSLIQRIDFNHDHFDELLLIEHNPELNTDDIKVLGYNPNLSKIIELPIIDYKNDLKDISEKDLLKDNLQVSFERVNGNYGFVSKVSLSSKQAFWVYYFQDAADRSFYPLKISAIPQSPNSFETAKSSNSNYAKKLW